MLNIVPMESTAPSLIAPDTQVSIPLIDPTVNTEQLTPIEDALALDKHGCTTARKLYAWLELDPGNYSRWVKVNILENPFAEEGIEYSSLKRKIKKTGAGRPSNDYTITATFAKKLAMTCPTERGEQARIYFLMAEKIAAEKKRTEEVRKEGIIVRRTLTDALVQSGEMDRMKGHAPSTYTDMIYKAALGMSAKQLKKQHGITNKLRDFLTAEELEAIINVEHLVVAFLENGCQYNEIKSHLMQLADAKQKRLSA